MLIDDQYALLDGVEHRFQKSLLPRQTQNVCLTAARIQVVETLAEPVEEIFFDCHVYKSPFDVYIYGE